MTESNDLLRKAAEMRRRALTPEQEARRKEVDARAEAIQSGPIKRGPNAPADGTFGGVRKGER